MVRKQLLKKTVNSINYFSYFSDFDNYKKTLNFILKIRKKQNLTTHTLSKKPTDIKIVFYLEKKLYYPFSDSANQNIRE